MFGEPEERGYTVEEILEQKIAEYNLAPDQADAVRKLAWHESKLDPLAQNPKSSATGVFQFINKTGAKEGLNVTKGPDDERFNPLANIDAGIRHFLKNYEDTGSIQGAVEKHYSSGDPTEDKKFARTVLKTSKVASGVHQFGEPEEIATHTFGEPEELPKKPFEEFVGPTQRETPETRALAALKTHSIAREEQETTNLANLIAGPARETNLLEAMDIPMLPLRKALEFVHRKAIEPHRAWTEEQYIDAIESGAMEQSAAPEAFAPLPAEKPFVMTAEMALIPAYFKLLGLPLRAIEGIGALRAARMGQTIVGETLSPLARAEAAVRGGVEAPTLLRTFKTLEQAGELKSLLRPLEEVVGDIAISRGQVGRIKALQRETGLDDTAYRKMLQETAGVNSSLELKGPQINTVIQRLNQIKSSLGPVVEETVPITEGISDKVPGVSEGFIKFIKPEIPRTEAGVPLIATPQGSDLTNLAPKLMDADIAVRGKWSVDVPLRMFDELDRVAPGASEGIYWNQKAREAAALANYKEIEGWSRGVQSTLPRKSSRTIGEHAIAQQEGGLETLTEMGITPKTLSPEQNVAYDHMRSFFEDTFGKLNQSRVLAGAEPIDKVENYFTFMRKYIDLVNEGGNPLTAAAEYFSPKTPRLTSAIERVKNARADLETDAFKVFRRYTKSATNYIYQAPHSVAVKDLAAIIGGEAPGTAKNLTQWMDTILGVKKVEISPAMDKVIGKIINNIGVATLGGYVRSATIQPTAMALAMNETGVASMIKAVGQNLTPKWRQFAKDNFYVLSTREFDVSVKEGIEALSGAGRLRKIQKGAAEIAYWPLHATDAEAARISGLAAFDSGRKTGMSMEEAIKYANDIIIRTQGSAARSDLARIQTHVFGKAATQFQTFVINELGYMMKDVAGIKNPSITNKEAVKKTLKLLGLITASNIIMEDVIGMRSPFPTPIREAKKALKEGKGVPGALLGSAKELAQQLPVAGYGIRYGGSPFGPVASMGSDITAALSGKGRSPWWVYPAKLAGVPGTMQLERLMQVPGKLTTKEALLGRDPAWVKEEKMKKPRRPSPAEVLKQRSYIKEGDPLELLRQLMFLGD